MSNIIELEQLDEETRKKNQISCDEFYKGKKLCMICNPTAEERLKAFLDLKSRGIIKNMKMYSATRFKVYEFDKPFHEEDFT